MRAKPMSQPIDDNTTPQLIVPTPSARRLLGNIGHTKLYELVNAGEIVKVNVGRRGFITRASIDAYVARLTNEATAATA
ncbi:helix-turn-helix domain-containing protein [Mycolicibacterium gilvum]|uniref:helix-turn-helix domain-containing protein n=1 Tax=Mycolicibacterium gilvum TaxID=1804 RepID=UPI00404552DD